MNVAAGIVTYNPSLQRLEENIEAISPQVGEVLLYDNASSNVEDVKRLVEEGTWEVPISIICGQKNAGLAVALNNLCDEARTRGMEFILLLDQDTVVEQDLVTKLVGLADGSIGIVAPLFQDRNEVVERRAAERFEDVKRAITSGSLLRLDVWERVGGYDENLFIDWVDYEFCDRLLLNGYRIVRNNDASILHELGNKEFVKVGWTFSPTKGLRKEPIYRNDRPYSRRYDRIKGESYTTAKYRGTFIWRLEAYMLVCNVLYDLVRERRRLELVRAAFCGYVDGNKLVHAAKRRR